MRDELGTRTIAGACNLPGLFASDIHHEAGPAWDEAEPADAGVVRDLLGADAHVPVSIARWATANSKNYRIGDVVVKRLPVPGHYEAAASAAKYLPWAFPCHVTWPGTSTYVLHTGDAWWVKVGYVGGCYYRGHPLSRISTAVKSLIIELSQISPDGLERREVLSDEEWTCVMDNADTWQIADHVEEVSAIRSSLKAESLRTGHIDLHPHNILLRPDGGFTFLDVASVRRAPLATALGYAAYKLARLACVARPDKAKEYARELTAGWDELVGRRALWLGAKAEMLKRIAYIELESRKGRTDWFIDLGRHLIALPEIDWMRTDQ